MYDRQGHRRLQNDLTWELCYHCAEPEVVLSVAANTLLSATDFSYPSGVDTYKVVANMMEQYSDQEWIRRLKQDDPQAKETLWSELFKTAVAYARFRGIDEDLARDATVEAYWRIMTRGIYQYKFQGPFAGFCRRILVNEINRLLGGDSPLTEDIDDKPDGDPGMEDPTPRASLEVIRQRIEECMEALTKLERKVIELLYFVGLSPEQVADELGIERNYVNVLAHRARKKIKDCLEAKGFKTVADVLGL